MIRKQLGDEGEHFSVEGQKEGAMPVCPACQSKDVVPCRDPKTGRLTQMMGQCLWVCTGCKNQFAEDAGLALVYLAREEDDDSKIAGDRFCVECGYNLNTLCVGGRCPECGTKIHHRSTTIFLESRRRWSGWNWAGFAWGCLVIGIVVLSRLYPQLNRIDLALAVFSLPMGGYGIKGLVTGVINPEPGNWLFGTEWRGLRGRICSIAYLLGGLALLVIAVGIWQGWIR